jgi:hypothetical protein
MSSTASEINVVIVDFCVPPRRADRAHRVRPTRRASASPFGMRASGAHAARPAGTTFVRAVEPLNNNARLTKHKKCSAHTRNNKYGSVGVAGTFQMNTKQPQNPSLSRAMRARTRWKTSRGRLEWNLKREEVARVTYRAAASDWNTPRIAARLKFRRETLASRQLLFDKLEKRYARLLSLFYFYSCC